ncbi:alcohol dehydrogenase [Stemphylium lycopersici]|uniref:Alcohol dehydrogenase n=1 Tax=Stemphylium lycopersici TaxID=183478 RepID=A0A364NH05_STELY|nr:alcohol dehydrogenase [Stemphylium lycopersici]RAR08316.1 alcohol dehydrogenase [Stemphylium lycopersici]RAR16381.1 alcohol dehydrogenase [Stemphylium lycopersici]
MATTTPSLPKKYKAAIYDKPGTISTSITTLDMPVPGAGEVLINLTHSGVCHSDVGVMTNSWKTLPFPTQAGQVGGHEGVGKIVQMGPGTENAAVKMGQRKISGYYTPGTFQQYVLAPANYVTPIPDALASDAAAPLLCAGVTVYSALRKTNASSGNWVVISGAGGGLGHLGVQFSARGIGHRVIGIDHSSKKDIVMESGAEHFIAVDGEQNVVEAVQALTDGLGAHAVVVCTASNAAYAQSVEMLRFGGRVVCVGIPEGEALPIKSSFPGLLVAKGLQIMGSAVGSRKEAIEAMDFAARGIVKTHFRTEKMEKLTEVFKEMDEGKLKGRVVLDLQD